MRAIETIKGEFGLSEWGHRRSYTVGLAGLFVGWHLLQLGVFHFVGEDVARWLFYFQKPPNIVSPGMLFAPISHDLYTLTHIGSNVVLLLVVGSVAEPYIGKDRVLFTVIGLGYLGTYLANVTVMLHKMWIVAGASGGILALGAYTGLQLRHQAYESVWAGLTWSWEGAETIIVLTCLVGIPVFLIHQTVWIDQLHSGHAIGILLGCLYYWIEAYVGDVGEDESGYLVQGD